MSTQSLAPAFTLADERTITEIDATARLWIHAPTGAQVLSFTTTDVNKVFGAVFRTPPDDSTGVAHILEHSVLCGSEKFPVKEPFVELLKGSLQTFLNAFTYPDKTCYPVASTNLHDFYNLIDVYLDAVFFPRLDEHIFQQEGWHLEADSPKGPASFKGVVYNEMKGVYSSPDSILAERSQQSIFPDTTYGLDSGGNPAHIPDLTFEQFVDFHATRYAPANTRFFFWGDDPEEKRLRIITELLERVAAKNNGHGTAEQAQAIRDASRVPLQSRINEPRRIDVPFAAGEDTQRGMMTVNWLLPESTDIDANFTLVALEHILLGLPGSPLRKALIESGLGEDVAAGLETELRQMYFSIGMKGVLPEDSQAVQDLILKTLGELAENGIASNDIEAALNSMEFSLREKNAGRFPVGLSIMLRSLTTWLYDADPLAMLTFEAPLQRLKARLATGEKVFEAALRDFLLNNTHRVTVVLKPDTQLADRHAREEAQRIAALYDKLDKQGRKQLVAETHALRELQERPDSPAALSTIPTLTLADLPAKNATIPTHMPEAQATVMWHDLPTAGIVYAEAAFELAGLPHHLIPFSPLLGRAFFEMDTANSDFAQLGARIAAKTGGMEADPLFAAMVPQQHNAETPVARMLVQGKAMLDKAPALFELFAETLTGTRLDDKDRFARMVLEEKARQEHSLLPRGNAVVTGRLAAGLTASGHMNEMTDGISYLLFLRELTNRINADWPGVLADLEALRTHIVSQAGCVFNITAPASAENVILPLIQQLHNTLPAATQRHNAAWPAPIKLHGTGEALIMPSQVNYVGKAINLYEQGYSYHGSLAVVLRHLRMAYLWDSVRVQGGAYGAGCSFNRQTGVLAFSSYRDPNIERTLKVYDGAAAYLSRLSLSECELQRAVIGAVGDVDTHLLPDAKGHLALLRSFTRDTDAQRQSIREEMLSTTLAHFKQAADIVASVSKGRIAVLGGAELEKTAAKLGLEAVRVL